MLPPTMGASPIPQSAGGGAASIMAALGLNQGVPTGQSALPPQMSAGPPQPQAPGALPPGVFVPPQVDPGLQGGMAPGGAPPPDPIAQMMMAQHQAAPTMGQIGSAMAAQTPPSSTMTGPLVPANPTPTAEQAIAMDRVIRALIAG